MALLIVADGGEGMMLRQERQIDKIFSKIPIVEGRARGVGAVEYIK